MTSLADVIPPLATEFTMVEFLRARDGHYFANLHTPASRSHNAREAKRLAADFRRRGYTFIGKHPALDDNGHPTTTTKWRRPTS